MRTVIISKNDFPLFEKIIKPSTQQLLMINLTNDNVAISGTIENLELILDEITEELMNNGISKDSNVNQYGKIFRKFCRFIFNKLFY